MGCDIHGVLQVKKAGIWVTIEEKPFSDRDYVAFALLAGVRNGRAITPISAPRGLPPRYSSPEQEKIQNILKLPNPVIEDTYIDGQWIGDHSHSYYLAEELLNYDWNKVVQKESGLVLGKNYSQWKSEHIEVQIMELQPNEDLPTYKEFTEEAFCLAKEEPGFNLDSSIVYVSVAMRNADLFDGLYSFVTNTLKPLAKEHGPKNVRWVFGFDS